MYEKEINQIFESIKNLLLEKTIVIAKTPDVGNHEAKTGLKSNQG